MNELRSVQQVIAALGSGDRDEGRRELMRLTFSTTQYVTNWLNARRFPARYWLVLSAALAKRGYRMHPRVCGQVQPLTRAKAS